MQNTPKKTPSLTAGVAVEEPETWAVDTDPADVGPNGAEVAPEAPGVATIEAGQPLDRSLVERRAYDLFEQRGSEHGHDLEDWYEAERELSERPSDY